MKTERREPYRVDRPRCGARDPQTGLRCAKRPEHAGDHAVRLTVRLEWPIAMRPAE